MDFDFSELLKLINEKTEEIYKKYNYNNQRCNVNDKNYFRIDNSRLSRISNIIINQSNTKHLLCIINKEPCLCSNETRKEVTLIKTSIISSICLDRKRKFEVDILGILQYVKDVTEKNIIKFGNIFLFTIKELEFRFDYNLGCFIISMQYLNYKELESDKEKEDKEEDLFDRYFNKD
jgi:hypothetical protein